MSKEMERAPPGHVDERGAARMVSVAGKPESERLAVARGRIKMKPETLQLVLAAQVEKGEVLQVARVAAIQAVKRTADLIPLCHPLRITSVVVDLTPDRAESAIDIEVQVVAFERTGVEMEALCGVTVAALTIYDMCKAVDRAMWITDVRLVEKRGGKGGDYVAP